MPPRRTRSKVPSPLLTSHNVRLHICVASDPHPTHPPLHHHLEQGSSGRNLTSCSGPRGRGFAVDLVPLPASRRTARNRLCCTSTSCSLPLGCSRDNANPRLTLPASHQESTPPWPATLHAWRPAGPIVDASVSGLDGCSLLGSCRHG